MQELTVDTFKNCVLGNEKPCLVYFYSLLCQRCTILTGPALNEIEPEYVETIPFFMINGKVVTELASQFTVKTYPVILIFENGEVTNRLDRPVGKEQIQTILKRVHDEN